eukprot:524245-Amorphochlora_amoeboformis.AAC.1
MDLKNCPKCGAPCPLVGQFCPSCGHKFNKKNINHTQKQEPAKTEPKKAPEEVAKEKAEKSIRIREKVAQALPRPRGFYSGEGSESNVPSCDLRSRPGSKEARHAFLTPPFDIRFSGDSIDREVIY